MFLTKIPYESITDLHHGVVEGMIWQSEEHVDLFKFPTVYSYDNLLKSKTCVFEFNLASIGITQARWSRFLTQYVKKGNLRKWIDSIPIQNATIVNLFSSDGETKVRPSLKNPELEGHRWGSCFLGISFRKKPHPTMTLYSRAARMPTTATMELALVSNLATEIKRVHNIRGPIAFTWFCSVIHTTSWDTMPYLLYRHQMEEFIKTGCKLAMFVENRYKKIRFLEPTEENIPYGRQRRVAARVQQLERGEPLPDVWTQDLSLWKGHKE
jgi:hypothetical protein